MDRHSRRKQPKLWKMTTIYRIQTSSWNLSIYSRIITNVSCFERGLWSHSIWIAPWRKSNFVSAPILRLPWRNSKKHWIVVKNVRSWRSLRSALLFPKNLPTTCTSIMKVTHLACLSRWQGSWPTRRREWCKWPKSLTSTASASSSRVKTRTI